VTRRRRLDLELVRRGLAASRSEARDVIADGGVTVDGRPALKPGTLVRPDEPVNVSSGRRFVSRGGEKLAPALERFGIDPTGKQALDAGAGTGGFTHVLLERGAERVVAVDVGYGQLSWRLRQDHRVTVMERTNVRDLRPEDLSHAPDLIVADLSFISLRAVLPALAAVAAPRCDFVLLVKPQFEAGPNGVGRGGVVRDPDVWRRVLRETVAACRDAGLGPLDAIPSPLRGPAGNVEFLLHARAGDPGREVDLDEVVASVAARRTG
jgi:23S rRNA (cytidine1920-2'-O)/16S rRNA (cytidine1409-2'-O)-methyltransferase